MPKAFLRALACLMLALTLLLALPAPLSLAEEPAPTEEPAQTEEPYVNPETGCRAEIFDEAQVLHQRDRERLMEHMIPLTDYCSVYFWSCSEERFEGLEDYVSSGEAGLDLRSAVLFSTDEDMSYYSLHWYGQAEELLTEPVVDAILQGEDLVCAGMSVWNRAMLYYDSVLSLFRDGSLPEYKVGAPCYYDQLIFFSTKRGNTLEEVLRFAEEQCPEQDHVYLDAYEGILISGAVTIPQNMSLEMHSAFLTISDNAGLELQGSLYLNNGFVDLWGRLSGDGMINAYSGSLIEVKQDGCFLFTGQICAKTQDGFPIRGLSEDAFEVDPGEYFTYYELREEDARTSESEKETGIALQPGGGYQVVILDELHLLSAEETEKLRQDMQPLTVYGNVAFWTTDEPTYNSVEQARLKRRELFDLESGLIFAINMDARKLTIQSYGDLNRVIGVTRANVITNNVRRYATSRDYYTAASKAFGQVYSLMRGEQIAQPMKHFSNLCIALMLGLIVAMGKVFRHASSFRAPKPEDLIRYPESGILQDVYASYTHTERTYSPPSSSSDSSSGSSCSSCSSGGGSSCSSCGSGGSSSF